MTRRWLLTLTVVASAAHAICPDEQGDCLPSERACPPCPCPADEHGPVCALVVDEVKQLEGELAKLARGEHTGGLCGTRTAEPTGPGPWKALVEVELSSPDGPAVVGLAPEPARVEVNGRLVLRRRRVTRACALVNGQPAEVRVLPEQNGKQVIELRARRPVPLKVTVKSSGKEEPTGWLYAIPPFDWPDTEARPAQLHFDGGTSTLAPDRLPSEPDEPGVWSIVAVRVGRRVAARLVSPSETQVALTPVPPITMKVSVKAGKTALPLERLWFSDVAPGEPIACTVEAGLARWGIRALDGETEVTVDAPPGDRRCLFVEVNAGEVLQTMGLRVPSKGGSTVRRVLRLSEASDEAAP